MLPGVEHGVVAEEAPLPPLGLCSMERAVKMFSKFCGRNRDVAVVAEPAGGQIRFAPRFSTRIAVAVAVVTPETKQFWKVRFVSPV